LWLLLKQVLMLLRLILLPLGPLLPLLAPLSSPPLEAQTHAEYVHATSGTSLLPLEPRLKTGRVEDVIARKFLAT